MTLESNQPRKHWDFMNAPSKFRQNGVRFIAFWL